MANEYEMGKDYERLKQRLEILMANTDDLKVKNAATEVAVAEIRAAAAAEREQVTAVVTDLRASLAALQAQIDAGAGDPVALQEIADAMDANLASLAAAKGEVSGVYEAEAPVLPEV